MSISLYRVFQTNLKYYFKINTKKNLLTLFILFSINLQDSLTSIKPIIKIKIFN